MLSTDIPTKFVEAFAALASGTYRRAIPKTSADPVAASLDLGFPAGTFGPTGTPPDGRDFNGLLNQDTAWAWWQAAGGTVAYDSAFSTANNGYPKYAILASTTPGILWQSTADNNTTDPDGGSPANWMQITSPAGDAPTFTANSAGYAIGFMIGGVTRYIQFGSVFIGGHSVGTITYPVPMETIGICVGSGGPNSDDDSDTRVISSGPETAQARNADSNGNTFFWICAGF